jgi:hypothetical protein
MGSLLICRSEFQISHNLAISLALVFFLSSFLSACYRAGGKEGGSFVAVLTQLAPGRKKERRERKLVDLSSDRGY